MGLIVRFFAGKYYVLVKGLLDCLKAADNSIVLYCVVVMFNREIKSNW